MDESPTPHGNPVPQCSTQDCERTDLIKSAGVCRRCYQFVRVGRDPAKPLRNRRHGELCTYPGGCEEKQRCRDLCQKHYDLQRRGGKLSTRKQENPRRTKGAARKSRAEFLWANIDVRGPDECWPWLRSLTEGGYGQLSWGGSPIGAHRAVYEVTYGEIPKELGGERANIDHTCHDPAVCKLKTKCPHRACCNPAHMEVVPGSVNRRRGDTSREGNGQPTPKCLPGCTCKRHISRTGGPGSVPCLPGCTCKRHAKRPNGGRLSSPSCEPGCTCGKHLGGGRPGCAPDCMCGKHQASPCSPGCTCKRHTWRRDQQAA